MRTGLLAVLATAVQVVLLAAASTAHSAPAQIAIDVDCPALDDEERAALEARARADLVLDRVSDGTVTISCRGSSARIRWQPAGAETREGTASLPSDRAVAVDSLLEVVHALLSMTAEAQPRPRTDAVSRPVPPEAGSSVEAAQSSTPPSLDLAATVPRPEARPETNHATKLSWSRLRLMTGAQSELWSGAIGAAFGLHAGIRVALPGAWGVTLLAGPSWGVTSAGGLHAWSLWAVARVDRLLLQHLELGLGAGARVLWASAAGGSFAQSQLDGVTGGAVVSAAYRTSLGPMALSLGPELECLLRPIVVEANGNELFRVPALLAGLSLEASTL